MDLNKLIKLNGITSTSDGLLQDFINRGLLKAALAEIPVSIKKRKKEIAFLQSLKLSVEAKIKSKE